MHPPRLFSVYEPPGDACVCVLFALLLRTTNGLLEGEVTRVGKGESCAIGKQDRVCGDSSGIKKVCHPPGARRTKKRRGTVLFGSPGSSLSHGFFKFFVLALRVSLEG